MAAFITCAGCGGKLKIPEAALSKRIKCPACAATFVPQPPAGPPPAPDRSLHPAPAEAPPPTAAPPPVDEVLDVLPVPEDEAAGTERLSGRPPKPAWPVPPPRAGRRQPSPIEICCPWCDKWAVPEAEECPRCGRSFDPADLRAEADRMVRQRGWFQALSFVIGVPGLGLGAAGWALLHSETLELLPASLMMVLGNLLLWVGIGFGVAYKRYNLAWVLLGLLSLPGLIILALIPDERVKMVGRIKVLLRHRREGRPGRDFEDRPRGR